VRSLVTGNKWLDVAAVLVILAVIWYVISHSTGKR